MQIKKKISEVIGKHAGSISDHVCNVYEYYIL